MAEMTEKRFFIDERSGCIAVRDRTLTANEGNGLSSEMESVAWYRSGVPIYSKCPTCGHGKSYGWELKDGDAEAARVECDRLNATDEADLLAMGI